MSLEVLMERLIVSLDANTAAHTGKPVATAAATTTTGKVAGTTAAKATTTAKAPAIAFEAVKAAAGAVKAKSGAPVAKKLIAEFGKAESLNAVKPEQFAALLAACEAHMAADEGEVEADPEEDL